MKRYFINLKFKGTHYHGWQIQPNGKSVQEELERAMGVLFQHKVAVTAAGRTDAGVHATGMVAHFDSEKEVDQQNFIFHLNNLLSRDISIEKVQEVKPDFHARFAAKSRTYHYQITPQKDPFLEEIAYRYNRKVAIEKMNEAAQLMLGSRDFSCFSKSKTQTFTNNCDLQTAFWSKKGELYVFEVKANRFLRNMVRAIVGTLLEVGEGKRTVESIPELLESKNRSNAGVSVPAHGLFLVNVEYPEEGFI